jgi:WD40 repeat protein
LTSHASAPVVFISYSHREKRWLEAIRVYLAQYEAAGEFERWDDDYIQVGDRWEREITAALKRARVGVLLASAHLLASDFIRRVELPALLEAQARGDLRLVCVPVSAGDFEHAKLTDYQWVRSPDEPIDDLKKSKRNRELVRVAKEIRSAALKMAPAQKEAKPLTHVAPAKDRLSDGVPARLGHLEGVPSLPVRYVDRRQEIEWVKEALLTGSSNVLVHGMGGTGKTVLVSKLVRDNAVRAAFPDGIYWLTLGQAPKVLPNLHRFGTWIKLKDCLEDPSQAGEMLRNALRDHACLLILDDAWRTSDAPAYDVLGPRSRLLITTRDAGLAEIMEASTTRINLMTAEQAFELLMQWSERSRSEVPIQTATRLVEAAGRLPLAISLAGAQIASGCSWQEVLREIEEGQLEYLDHESRSVFASLAMSVDVLPAFERDRLLELAIFPEDTLIPASVVFKLWRQSCRLSADEGAAMLRAFRNRSLIDLSKDETTIQLHDLLRDFLRLNLEDPGQAHGLLLDAHHAELSTGNWADLNAANQYVWGNFAFHMIEAGRSAEMLDLLLDPTWMVAKIEAQGVAALVSDYRYFVGVSGAEKIEAAIHRSAHVLSRDPRQLHSQLMGQLGRVELEPVKKLLGRVGTFRDWPWLRPLRTSLETTPALERILDPPDHARSLAMSSNARTLYAGTDGGRIRCWDLQTGAELRPLAEGLGRVHIIRLMEESCRLFSASSAGGLQFWDLVSRRVLASRAVEKRIGRAEPVPHEELRALVGLFDHGGESDAGGDLQLVSLTINKTIWGLTGYLRFATAGADGVAFAAFSDESLRMISLESGKCLATITLPGVATCITTHAGPLAAVGLMDGRVCIWDGREEPRVYAVHGDAVAGLAFGTQSDRLLSAAGTLPVFKLWNINTGITQLTFPAHDWTVQDLVASRDGRHFASVATLDTVRVWNVEAADNNISYRAHELPINGFAFSTDGRTAISGANDGRIVLWDLVTASPVERLADNQGMISDVWMSSCGRHVAWNGVKRSCRRDLVSSKDVDLPDGVTSAAFAGNLERAILELDDARLIAWGLEDQARDLLVDSAKVSMMVVSADERLALSCHDDGSIYLWDLQIGELVMKKKHPGAAWVDFSEEGTRALCVWSSGRLETWDLFSSEVGVHSIPEGSWMVTSDGSHSIGQDSKSTFVWDVNANREIFRGRLPCGPLVARPNGKYIVAAVESRNRTLAVWELGTGNVIARFTAVESDLCGPAWSPDKRTLMIGERRGIVHVLRLEGCD